MSTERVADRSQVLNGHDARSREQNAAMREALLAAIRREQALCAESQTPPLRFEIEVDEAGDTIAKLSVLLNCGHKVSDLAIVKRTDEASVVCSKCFLVCTECEETIEPGEGAFVDGSWYHRTKRGQSVNCSLLATAQAENQKRAEERASRQALLRMQDEIAALREDVAMQRELSERQIQAQEDTLRLHHRALPERSAADGYRGASAMLGSDFTRRAREPDLWQKIKHAAQGAANMLPSEDRPVIRD